MKSSILPTRFNRREFMAAAVAAPSVALVQNALGADMKYGQTKTSPIVDTHVHCFAGRNEPRFPYHPRGPYQPELPATPQHLLNCMDEVGVRYAVIVHPEPYQDDHRYLEYCFEIGKNRFKGTCLFFADRPDSMARMSALAKRLPIIAARIHAYAPDRLPPFGKPELREFWRVASNSGLAVQIHLEPRYAPGFAPLIKEFSDTLVVIDHMGRPFQGTPDEHEEVLRWANLKNTIIKLSAIPSITSYPHRDPRQILERLVKAYGVDRVIYGGGFGGGATAKSYRDTINHCRSLLNSFSEADQEKVFSANAIRLFRFRSSP